MTCSQCNFSCQRSSNHRWVRPAFEEQVKKHFQLERSTAESKDQNPLSWKWPCGQTFCETEDRWGLHSLRSDPKRVHGVLQLGIGRGHYSWTRSGRLCLLLELCHGLKSPQPCESNFPKSFSLQTNCSWERMDRSWVRCRRGRRVEVCRNDGALKHHYPLVNVYITMENHHVQWLNQL